MLQICIDGKKKSNIYKKKMLKINLQQSFFILLGVCIIRKMKSQHFL